MCEIKYKLEARLHRPGILNFDATGKTDLKVFCSSEDVPPTPVTMDPDTQRLPHAAASRVEGAHGSSFK